MNRRLGVVALCALLVVGCSNKEEELKKQLSEAQSARTTLQVNIAERDAYFEEVMRAVNDVNADLEKVRSKEALIKKDTHASEGPMAYTSDDARQKLVQSISDIGNALKENRKRISELQAKGRAFGIKIASLNTMIENLKTTLQEREASIAQLQTNVQGLQAGIQEKSQLIEEKEGMIEVQKKKMNTAFYVIGTRDELKKKGIITNEGGFLWGLLGSTTIMASGVDWTEFTPIDRTKDQKIEVSGKIDEILPRRNPDLFATERRQEGSSELTIVSPDKFWQDKYLVIVVD